MKRTFLSRAFLIAATLAAAGCSSNSADDTVGSPDSGGPDATSNDAAADDGGQSEAGMMDDAGDDAGMDAGMSTDAGGDDAAADGSTEAGVDAGSDAGSDAGADATTDSGVDSGTVTEAGTDAASEAGSDGGASDAASGADGSTDASGGGSTDAGSTDAGSIDAGSIDAGSEAGTTCAYASTILADQPLAYLRFDEASGTTAADATGNGNAGTYKGGFKLAAAGAIATCPGDTGVALDGNSGWVDLGDKFGFTGTSPFSLEIWVNPSTINAEFRGVMTKQGVDSNNQKQGYDIFSVDGVQYGTALALERWQNGGSGGAGIAPTGMSGTAYAPVAGAWMHIVAVYDGTNAYLYTNGALVNGPNPSSQAIQALTGCSFAVGAFSCGTGGYFAGTVDEVAVYDKALTAAQVQAHYEAARGGSGIVVITPADGATISGPVMIQASDIESQNVQQFEVWADGTKLGDYGNPNPGATWQYFTQSYSLASGAHAITIFDYVGGGWTVTSKTTINVTVQ